MIVTCQNPSEQTSMIVFFFLFCKYYRILLTSLNPIMAFSMKTLQLNLISLLIFRSPPVKEVGGPGLDPAWSPSVQLWCSILAFAGQHPHQRSAHRNAHTPRTRVHIINNPQMASLKEPTQVMRHSLFKGSWHECLCEDENRDGDMFILFRSELWSQAKHQSLLLSARHCQRCHQSGFDKWVLNQPSQCHPRSHWIMLKGYSCAKRRHGTFYELWMQTL